MWDDSFVEGTAEVPDCFPVPDCGYEIAALSFSEEPEAFALCGTRFCGADGAAAAAGGETVGNVTGATAPGETAGNEEKAALWDGAAL